MGKYVRFQPVIVDGEIQLWDIFIEDEWFGSRRTFDQACLAVYGKEPANGAVANQKEQTNVDSRKRR